MNTHRTLSHTINQYKKDGYELEFLFKNDRLMLPHQRLAYDVADLTIIAEERFEGLTSPSDASIYFALMTIDGHKGYITTGYGPTANTELIDFLAQCKVEPQL